MRFSRPDQLGSVNLGFLCHNGILGISLSSGQLFNLLFFGLGFYDLGIFPALREGVANFERKHC